MPKGKLCQKSFATCYGWREFKLTNWKKQHKVQFKINRHFCPCSFTEPDILFQSNGYTLYFKDTFLGTMRHQICKRR